MTLQSLMSPVRRAVDDYEMIESGDKIAVGLSGGKDSLTLLSALAGLKRFYPKSFELVAIMIDLGFESDKKSLTEMKKYVEALGVELIVEKTDIGEIIFEQRKEKSPCSLCSKMRRGALNTIAIQKGCNKLALGHHADDLAETFLLSLFYEGRLSTFEAKTFLDRSNITVIRPMIYLEEKDVLAFAKDLPVVKNNCPADKHTRREYMKDLIKTVKKEIPFAKSRMLSALFHPERNHLLSEVATKKDSEK